MQPEKKTDALSGSDDVRDLAVVLTQQFVRVGSVTAIDPRDADASRDCLKLAEDFARAQGARVERLSYAGGHKKWDYGVDNAYIEWTFGEPKKHLCYIGHLDVVPPGDAAKWSGDPFSGDIRDGYLYGRGATDMKGSVAAFLAAMAGVKDSLKDVRISMIVTMDEEWAAVNGTRKVLAWMQERGLAPDSFVVGEPSSHDVLGSHIKIGRRGSLVGTLRAEGVQGHAAYQELFENPNRALALAAAILNEKKWDDGSDYFPSSNFEVIATQSGNFQASAVVPGAAELLWNVRFTPQQTPESLEQWIVDALKNPPLWARAHPDAPRLESITVTANKDTASMPYCSTPGALAGIFAQSIRDVAGIDTVIDGSGGTTDGRFAALAYPDAEIIECGLPERGGLCCAHRKPDDYLAKGGMHQVDERAAVADLVNLRKIYGQALRLYGHG